MAKQGEARQERQTSPDFPEMLDQPHGAPPSRTTRPVRVTEGARRNATMLRWTLAESGSSLARIGQS